MQLLCEGKHSMQAEREHAGPVVGHASNLAMSQLLCRQGSKMNEWSSCAAIFNSHSVHNHVHMTHQQMFSEQQAGASLDVLAPWADCLSFAQSLPACHACIATMTACPTV